MLGGNVEARALRCETSCESCARETAIFMFVHRKFSALSRSRMLKFISMEEYASNTRLVKRRQLT